MLASSSQGAFVAPSSGNAAYLTIAQAAAYCNCSCGTIRNAFRQGEGVLPVYRLTAGNKLSRTRFKLDDLNRWLGNGPTLDIAGKDSSSTTLPPVGIVARVSSHGQREDLTRQVSRLREHALEHYPGSPVTEYVRVGSGMNAEHPVFCKLVRDICEGKFSGGYLLCTYKDRILRFSFKLVVILCKLHGVTLIQTEAEEPKSLMDELTNDILQITHVASCSFFGRRSSRNHSDIHPQTTSDIILWSNAGLSLKAIYAKLSEAGRAVDGRGNPFKVATVRRIVEQAKASASLVKGNSPAVERTSFSAFWKAKVVISENKAAKVDREVILKAYAKWVVKQLGKGCPMPSRKASLAALADYLNSLPGNVKPTVQKGQDQTTGKRFAVLTGVSLLSSRWDSL